MLSYSQATLSKASHGVRMKSKKKDKDWCKENEKNTRREEMMDSSDESWQVSGDKSFIRWLEPVNHMQSYLASPFYLSIYICMCMYNFSNLSIVNLSIYQSIWSIYLFI